MDKILAILNKAKSSLTVWAMGALALLDQFTPVANWINDVVAKVAPGKAAAVVAVIAIITRLRSIITGALASLSAPKQP